MGSGDRVVGRGVPVASVSNSAREGSWTAEVVGK